MVHLKMKKRAEESGKSRRRCEERGQRVLVRVKDGEILYMYMCTLCVY